MRAIGRQLTGQGRGSAIEGAPALGRDGMLVVSLVRFDLLDEPAETAALTYAQGATLGVQPSEMDLGVAGIARETRRLREPAHGLLRRAVLEPRAKSA